MQLKVFVIILLVGGIITSCKIERLSTPNPAMELSIEKCRQIEDALEYSNFPVISQKHICLAEFAYITGNDLVCREDEMTFCRAGVAARKRDASLCGDEFCMMMIGTVSTLDDCKNISLNSPFEDSQEWEKGVFDVCKFGHAIKNNKIEICSTFDSQSHLRYLCEINIAKRTRSNEICVSMEEGVSEECFFQVAIEKKDVNLCYKLADRAQECQNILTRKRAKNEGNPFKCLELDDHYEAADCLIPIAIDKRNENYCHQLQPGFGSVQQDCFAKVGIVKQNLTLCAASIGSPFDNDCYKEVLSKKVDPAESCKMESGISLIYCINNLNCEITMNPQICQEFVEGSRENASLCKQYLFEGEQTDCYIAVAKKTKSPAPCMLDQYNKDHCILTYAKMQHDIESCKLYSDPDSCEVEVNSNQYSRE